MPPRVVFVDPSGRRARWFFRACWALGAVMSVYVGLVVLSLMAPPGVSRLGLGPLLPRPVAPPLSDPAGGRRPPVEVLDKTPGSSAYPQPTSAGERSPSTSASPTAVTAPSTGPSNSRRPSPTATASPPTGVPSSAGNPTPKSGSRPTPQASRTPPGRR